MRYCLIIFCFVLLLAPAVAGAEAPAVTGITPATGSNATTVAITNLAGTNFTNGATVMLTPGTVNPIHKGSIVNGGSALLLSPRNVFVSGNYAYVASAGSNALEIVDVTNPAVPVHKSSISNGAGGALLSNPQSVFVAGNHAYVASYGSNALEIVDVTDPAAPVHKGSIQNGAGGAELINPYSVYVSGNHAYMASYGSSALEIVDVTNPATPIHKNSTYIDTPRSVFVSSNYAYVTSAGSDALEIVDVTNPAAPVHTGRILNGGNTLLNNPYSVYVSGNYAYVASYSSNALEIVDVTNPAAPVHKGSITNIFLSSPQSVSVSGNYAYIASDGINALEIVDVTNPAAPVHKGYIQDGSGVAPFLRDPVGVYISGNYAYVASLASNALEVVDIGSVTATSVNVVSANQITCSVNLSNKVAGLYNVVVTNPDGKFGTLPNGFTISAAGAPVASFYGTPLAGAAPLNVTFTDTSTSSPASWYWLFGDGNFSTLQNPVHTYVQGGAYTVSMYVTNTKGTDAMTRIDYVIVNGNKIGVFRNATGTWYLDYNLTGVVDKSFQFGKSGDVPVVGDWDGDGTMDTGIFRPSVGTWYLNYYKDSLIDKTFRFGKSGDIPLVGDWNGDGIMDAGIFRPVTGTWYLDTTKTGVISSTFQFGKSGDIPVTGDWNGDGVYDAGVFRPATGTWYLDTTKSGVISSTFRFGKSGDIPVIGDWNGNGDADNGVFRPATGVWYLDITKTGVASSTFQFGKSGDVPVVSDWDGEGTYDAGVFRPVTGTWYLNYHKTGIVDKTLRFGKDGDSPQAGMWFTVNPVPVMPVAAFTNVTPRTGIVPLTVQFADESTSNTRLTYAWDFNNDGIVESTAKNPAYTYAAEGNYTVNLTVTNGAGSDAEVRNNFITVNPVPVAPVAAFTNATSRSGTAPLTVQFTDQSTGTPPLTYAWDFENDGVTDSTAPSPSHVYSLAGTYSVNLTVTNVAGSNSTLRTNYITVTPPVLPVAAFTNTTPRSGIAPLNVTFTDQSTGTPPLTYAWDFENDGVTDSTAQSPSHVYSAGTYSVNLTVTNVAGSNSTVKANYITVSPAPVAPVAAFTNATPRSGTTPLTVQFTDQSTGTLPLTYAWDFNNDGVIDNTTPSPSYVYTSANTYTVNLTVTNIVGSDSEVKTGYITVSPAPVAPVAAFTNATPRSGTTPLTVQFTDQSTGTAPLIYAWDFDNDGVIDNTTPSPSYEYTSADTYTVNLTVTNIVGSDSELKTGYITVSPAPVAPVAAFTNVTPRSGTAPLTVEFIDQSTGTPPLTYAWDFNNDGVIDNTTPSPSYEYISAETYTVNLTVTNAVASDSEEKADYITVA